MLGVIDDDEDDSGDEEEVVVVVEEEEGVSGSTTDVSGRDDAVVDEVLLLGSSELKQKKYIHIISYKQMLFSCNKWNEILRIRFWDSTYRFA